MSEREWVSGRAGEREKKGTGTVYTNERVGSAAECRLLITAGSEVQQQQWRQQQLQQGEQRNTNNKAQKTMNAEWERERAQGHKMFFCLFFFVTRRKFYKTKLAEKQFLHKVQIGVATESVGGANGRRGRRGNLAAWHKFRHCFGLPCGNALCLVDLPINNSNYVWFQRKARRLRWLRGRGLKRERETEREEVCSEFHSNAKSKETH